MSNPLLGKDGFLLPRKKRLKLQKLLEEERDGLIALIEDKIATPADKSRFVVVDDQAEQARRINECEFDVARFAVEYFSDDVNVDNDENLLPEGVNYDTMSNFHKELCGLLSDITLGVKRSHVAWACPRGHAKTAYGSNIFPIHQAVYRHKRFMVIISETTDMAGAFITWGNTQMKRNEKLIEDFGTLMHVQPSRNKVDNRNEYVTQNGVKVMAVGAGKQIRGMRFGKLRPELMILDDLEGEEHVSTAEQMEKMEDWFQDQALPALSKDGLCLYLGTILAYNSLLDKVVRNRGDFESRKYKAVKEFPSNVELWEDWKRIYMSDSSNRAAEALEFYEAHEDDMLEGVELLWGEYWSYYDFIQKLINNGAKSFNQEYQNEPTDEERQVFKPNDLFYFDESDIDRIPYEDREYYAGVDFAMGKEKGDYSTIATILKNKQSGRAYVVDIYEGRLHTKEFMEKVIEFTLRYEYESIAVESQMAQEFFTDYLMEELIKRGYPSHSRVKKIKQRTRKALRIEALQPEMMNGNLRLNRKHTNLIEQFSMYPMAPHDDMIDAVEMAYRGAQQGVAGIIRTVNNSRGNMRRA